MLELRLFGFIHNLLVILQKYILNIIFLIFFITFKNRIRTIWLDPDPAKRFGSERIRIRNTGDGYSRRQKALLFHNYMVSIPQMPPPYTQRTQYNNIHTNKLQLLIEKKRHKLNITAYILKTKNTVVQCYITVIPSYTNIQKKKDQQYSTKVLCTHGKGWALVTETPWFWEK